VPPETMLQHAAYGLTQTKSAAVFRRN